MVYAILSDIHGNLPALVTALDLLPPEAAVVCLGDIVGYGASPSECVRLISENASVCIRGNHERMLLDAGLRLYASENALKAIEWTETALDESSLRFIESLPTTAEQEGRILIVHGSPRHPDEYIVDRNTLRDSIYALEEMGKRLCFFGHTHVPAVYDDLSGDSYAADKEIELDPERIYLINPGSVGQPRDKDKRGSFCLFDSKKLTVKFERFDYDIKAASEMILSSGLPQGLATRLYYGM